MLIEVVTDELRRPATELAAAILRQATEDRTDIEFNLRSYAQRSRNADVVLLMGYDARSLTIKQESPASLVGIVDPRPRQELNFEGTDFLLPNGFESWQHWRYTKLPQTYFYLNELADTQSQFDSKLKAKRDMVRFGFLGNSVHLRRLREVARKPINYWATRIPLEVWLYISSDIKVKDWQWLPVEPRLFPLGSKSLREFLDGVDIGLVPQLKPLSVSDRLANVVNFLGSDRNNVVALNFKPTTNPGRLWTFSQASTPVIVDSSPSSNQIIGENFREFLAFDKNSWAYAIDWAIQNPVNGDQFGSDLRRSYLHAAHPTAQLNRLTDFVGLVRANGKGFGQ